MGRLPKHSPSFFKVMLCDFTSKLIIPPVFAKKHEEMFTNNKCILKIDDHTEKSWIVKMENDKKEYFFGHGWKKFARENHVQIGEFLVFFLIGVSRFQVMLYGRSGCLKSFLNSVHFENGEPTRNPTIEIEETDSDEDVIEIPHFPTETEHPHFENIMKKYHKYFMIVPKEFAEETGILRKGKTQLKDPEGRAWPVNVHLSAGGRRAEMGSGWSSFRKANKLEEGDKCLFRYIGGGGGGSRGGGMVEVRFVRKIRGGSHRARRSCECATDFVSSTKEIRGGMFGTKSHKHPKIIAAEREKSRDLALERAKAFKSQHPSFIVIMRPSYVTTNCNLNIPFSFVKKYFTEKHYNVFLRVTDDGRIWVAKYFRRLYKSELSGEWKTFIRDNRLKIGDVCVFELMEEVENSLKVIIFRAN